MKHCPTCQRSFDDEKVFCGSDGRRLVADTPTAYAEQPSAPPSSWPASPTEPTTAWPSTPAATPPAQYAPPAPHAASPPAHAGPLERIRCEWCQAMNEGTALSCRACGAPLDIKNLISESGWREAPRIKDMTEIHFGMSTCQVEGEIVPVAELNLAQGDAV